MKTKSILSVFILSLIYLNSTKAQNSWPASGNARIGSLWGRLLIGQPVSTFVPGAGTISVDHVFVGGDGNGGLNFSTGNASNVAPTFRMEIAANGNVRIDRQLNIAGLGGTNVDLQVGGRIKSNHAEGGLWCGNNNFVGTTGQGQLGLYVAGQWRLLAQAAGITISDNLVVNGSIHDINGNNYIIGVSPTISNPTISSPSVSNGTFNAPTITNGKVSGSSVLEFGAGLTKEVNAGKIGYGTYSSGASLDIVGAGSNSLNRKIMFFNEGGATFRGKVEFRNANGNDNTDPMTIEQVHNGSNVSELRMSLGDDLNSTDDKLSIGVYTGGTTWRNFLTLNTAGELRVKKSIVTQLGWADYVFAKEYQLKSLSEVEKYILENNHLPNIPSAQEVAEKGLDTGEMLKLQMEKIEELTLHLIQQQKEIEALKKALK